LWWNALHIPISRLPVVFTDPNMHAIGNLVKALCFFVLAVLRARDQEDLRHFMLRKTAKGGLEKLFFREFRFDAAAIFAFPSLLGDYADPYLSQLMCPVLLFSQAWTLMLYGEPGQAPGGVPAAAGGMADRTSGNRRAVVVLCVASSLLLVFYHVLKPLDLRTKNKGVHSLDLHGPEGHLDEELARSCADGKPLTDNHTEGGTRALKDFVLARAANNAWFSVIEKWVTSRSVPHDPDGSGHRETDPEEMLHMKALHDCR